MGAPTQHSDLPPVLVAEDDALACSLIQEFLKRLRLQNPVVAATDGDEAVGFLERLDPPPVLAVLDVRMPGRSGIEVLRWVREQPRLRSLPVILLTGAAEKEEVSEAHRLGVGSYLVKPVAYEALGEVLRDLGLPWSLHSPDPPETGAL